MLADTTEIRLTIEKIENELYCKDKEIILKASHLLPNFTLKKLGDKVIEQSLYAVLGEAKRFVMDKYKCKTTLQDAIKIVKDNGLKVIEEK